MIRYLFFIALALVLYFWAKGYIKNSPPEELRSRKVTLGIMVFAGVMIILAMTGRMHWLAAAIAALLPVVKALLQPILTAVLTSAHKKHQEQSSGSGDSGTVADKSTAMDEEQARQILGLSGTFTKEDVVEAHRKLMQKNHPDRGGNDYLAAQINRAKEILLAKF